MKEPPTIPEVLNVIVSQINQSIRGERDMNETLRKFYTSRRAVHELANTGLDALKDNDKLRKEIEELKTENRRYKDLIMALELDEEVKKVAVDPITFNVLVAEQVDIPVKNRKAFNKKLPYEEPHHVPTH